ncbi:MAG: hypothetical protein IJV62_03875, partial [Eggerthellaceae bacterium]|nr:hypothetical protein [Eggerthellaceae bacterium]
MKPHLEERFTMAVPKFDELFEPFLAALNDNNEHSASEMKELVSKRINISNEDRNETMPSGKQTRFDSNIGWAKTYLEKAGLMQTVKRGVYKITPLGQKALSSHIPLNIEYLQQFESFQEFQTIKSSPRENHQEGKVINNTPDEDLESAYEAIQKRLEEDLYEKILELEPYHFEYLVLKLL